MGTKWEGGSPKCPQMSPKCVPKGTFKSCVPKGPLWGYGVGTLGWGHLDMGTWGHWDGDNGIWGHWDMGSLGWGQWDMGTPGYGMGTMGYGDNGIWGHWDMGPLGWGQWDMGPLGYGAIMAVPSRPTAVWGGQGRHCGHHCHRCHRCHRCHHRRPAPGAARGCADGCSGVRTDCGVTSSGDVIG